MVTTILLLGVGGTFGIFYMAQRRSLRARTRASVFLVEAFNKLSSLPYRQQIRWVALSAAGLGLIFGTIHTAIQVAVEQGQVLAGIVDYPVDNPFYLIQIKSWNVWAQLAAGGLIIGLNEIVLSIILSALAGAMVFVGLALILLSITKSPAFSLAGVFIALGLIRASQAIGLAGYSYPLVIVGTTHSFGMLGLNYMVLCIGLLAVGETAWAFVLLGFSVAAHASLAVWTGLTALVCLLIRFRGIRGWLRFVPFAIVGLLGAAASYLIQRLTFPSSIEIDVQSAQSYLATYLQIWDLHRATTLASLIQDPTSVLVVASMFVCAALGLLHGADDNPDARLFVWFIPISAGIAILFALWSQNAQPLADQMAVLMPIRYLNVSLVCLYVWLVGLCYDHRAERWISIILLIGIPALIVLTIHPEIPPVLAIIPLIVITVLALAPAVSPVRRWGAILALGCALAATLAYKISAGFAWGWALVILTVFGLATWLFSRIDLTTLDNPDWLRRIKKPLQATNITALITLLSVYGISTLYEAAVEIQNTQYLSQFWAEAANREGFLVESSASFYPTQLRTRRPILLELGIFDSMPYAIEGFPQVEQILKDIYHVDFDSPPLATRHRGELIELPEIKATWEARSVEEWQALAAKYGFTQVLTTPGWRLKLPTRATSPEGILYDVP